MLTSSDIGNLFAAMRAIYGNQWKHGREAMPVWLNALRGAEPDALSFGLRQTAIEHPDYPPTLPQFVYLAKGPAKRITTYLPAPSFDQANHDKAIREMNRLRDMPAYRPLGVAEDTK